MLTLIATLVVWAFVQALCAKNPGPLMVLLLLYAILNLIAEIMY